MIKIDEVTLRQLILKGISTEELDSTYDYSGITDTSHMFSDCESLVTVPLFDTSNVTDTSYMFNNCSSLETVPLFDTSNVVDMRWILDGCLALKDVNPYNFQDYDFSKLNNPYLKETYPELYI